MSPRSEQKQHSHAKIIASAARLVCERGISGTSVAEAMQGAGLTVGGFYAHFEARANLIDEAIRHAASEVRNLLFSSLEHTPAETRATAVIDRYLSRAHRGEPALRCPFPSVLGEVATRGEHQAALSDAIEALAAELENVMKESADRRVRALGLLCVMVGALTLSRALAKTTLSDQVLLAGRKAARAILQQND